MAVPEASDALREESPWTDAHNLDVKQLQDVVLFPNPGNDELRVKWESAVDSPVTLDISSMDGRRVLSRDFDSISGSNTIRLDMSSVHAGSYVVTLRSESTVKQMIWIKTEG